MKYLITLIVISFIVVESCQLIGDKKTVDNKLMSDTTGIFTGVKRYYQGERLIKEVTFVNGVKEGVCKNYYDDGRLRSTIIYSNNVKEDTARWYYTEGMVFRSTPYVNNKIDGEQIKYYKNGRVQASLPYRNGHRMPGLKEYYENGLEIKSIPSVEYTIKDIYAEEGLVRVFLKLSNGSVNVDFYKGGLIDGTFIQDRYIKITASTGMGFIELHKDSENGRSTVNVIAVYTTRFGNKEIIPKTIRLPYNDLI